MICCDSFPAAKECNNRGKSFKLGQHIKIYVTSPNFDVLNVITSLLLAKKKTYHQNILKRPIARCDQYYSNTTISDNPALKTPNNYFCSLISLQHITEQSEREKREREICNPICVYWEMVAIFSHRNSEVNFSVLFIDICFVRISPRS